MAGTIKHFNTTTLGYLLLQHELIEHCLLHFQALLIFRLGTLSIRKRQTKQLSDLKLRLWEFRHTSKRELRHQFLSASL
ncbi:hypothetical protein T10_6543 [Trichinella papuae]|uniref:Uncharacterized protein n=1 Tax=Trichinella papuae TaxID=268474 RepID=A0A0V1MBH8_9BILA|nr:hypothetical protein T10_6543 [Trichinella papuae]